MSEGWREISSAPKDGTRILGWWNNCEIIASWRGHWGSTEDWRGPDNHIYVVTHWQPLPAPPTEKVA